MATRAPQISIEAAFSVLLSLPRNGLEKLAERIIEHFDQIDGDPDANDGQGCEDEFGVRVAKRGIFKGPGCPLSDPDVGVDDRGELENEDGEPEVAWLLPEYGDNQDRDPVNGDDAYRGFQRAQGWCWNMDRRSWKRGY